MRILFVMRHSQYVRNYESTIQSLAERGHKIHLAFTPMRGDPGAPALADRLAAQYPNVTHGSTPAQSGFWAELVKVARSLRDRLRYLHEDYRDCQELARRATVKGESVTRWLGKLLPSRLSPSTVARLDAALKAVDSATPASKAVVAAVRRAKPDVVLVTPMVDLGSQQREYVKAAQELGIPAGLCVASWDNLTNKGLVQVVPQRVFVWNEHQRREAVRYHGVGNKQVVVTGAQCYDQWFERRPSTTREEFCRRAGLPSAEPFLVYLSSSKYIAPREADFVHRWIRALRAQGDPALRGLQVLVRPHPGNPQDWSIVDELEDAKVAIFPREGQQVHNDDARANYFDTLYYGAAAVGVNTSAMIEAGIAGCVCHTIRLPEFRGTQDGTLHFAYLVRDGYVKSAKSFEEHFGQLAETLARPEQAKASLERFLADFVRPRGLDQSGTSLLVEEIEKLGHLRGARTPAARSAAVRAGLAPLAAALSAVRWYRSSRGAASAADDARRASFRGWTWPRAEEAKASAKIRKQRASALTKSSVKTHVRQVARYLDGSALRPWHTRRAFRAAALRGGDVVVGPWLSEVGFELLYWIPMLRHFLKQHGIPSSRVVAISRGGVADWYRGVADRYVEIFDLMTPEEFHDLNQQREAESGGKKQNALLSLDQRIVDAALHEGRIKSPTVLHPHLMYKLFPEFWRGRAPLSFVHEQADFSRLPTDSALEIELPLDGPYYAVKFYYSSCFPHTRANAELVERLVRRLARRRPVMLLDTGLRVDDHSDCMTRESSNIYSARALLRANNNLAVQSALVARSEGLYCTYGGFSYLAPFLGRPVVSLYSERNFVPAHLLLAEGVFNGPGEGLFTALATAACRRWLDDMASEKESPRAKEWAA